VFLALLAVGSCDFATDVELLEIGGTGVVRGQAYLDLNGNGTGDAGDQPLSGATVILTTPGTGDVVLNARTDTLGAFSLFGVPVGTYSLGLSPSVLGDSLSALGTGSPVTVTLGDTAVFVIGATYPMLSLEEVRATSAGRRVFTTGVALNARLPSTDGTVHLIDTAAVAWLRATGVSVPTGNIAAGDSVRFLGRTAVDNGQPVLDAVTPIVLQRGLALPPPVEATTGTAATADGGALDAAVLRVRRAEISDTSTAPNGDFHFWVDDGSGALEVVLKWFRGISATPIRPATIVQIDQLGGLLTPFADGTGGVRWRLLPRAASEVIVQNKTADIAVGTSFAPTTAVAADVVEITVTVSNLPASTHTATGVSVTDTIPSALTFLSATATAGSYSEVTGLWDVGDLAPGEADTLRLSVQVTGPPGSVVNRARSNGLVLEVDPNASNDVATANLTVN